jgi:transposase-like protein
MSLTLSKTTNKHQNYRLNSHSRWIKFWGAGQIEDNIPEGLAVFALPVRHRKRMRTTNMLERLHEEIKRRTRVARLFPNEDSLLRLVSAIEMEISEDWIAGKRYLDMNVEMENESESADSKEKRIYRTNVA